MLTDARRWILEGAGFTLREDVKSLRLHGPDRVRYLNGMVSRDVTRLSMGQGVRAVKSSNRGRVEAIVRIRADVDALWIDVKDAVAEALRRNLEKLIIMDDCVLEDRSAER